MFHPRSLNLEIRLALASPHGSFLCRMQSHWSNQESRSSDRLPQGLMYVFRTALLLFITSIY
jgi:hypothetical protein